MNIILKIIFVFVAMSLSQLIHAAHALPEFDANYAVKKFGAKLAEARYQLTHTDTGYKFMQDTKLYGFARLLGSDTVSAVSYIHQTGDQLLLQKHSYRQTGKEKNKNEDINISWQSGNKKAIGKIDGVVHSKKISLVTEVPIWEALSFQIPLMIEANKDVKEYPYNAIINGEIDTYNFVLTDIQNIRFADEDYQALHMVRIDPKKDRKLSIWLAPKLHNLPLLVENYRDGKEHSRMELESIKFTDKNILLEQASFNLDRDDEDDF